MLELRGGIDDEISAWNGTSIFVNKDGLFSECESNCEHSQAKKKECVEIELIWDDDIGNPVWHFETKIPHETFKIYDEYNGEKFVFCEGIVFCLDEIKEWKMGVDYNAVSGFGYKISCEEYSVMASEDEDFDLDEYAELPEGFSSSSYGNHFTGQIGLLITINSDLSEILRGEKPLPDVSPLLEWAEKHDIKFENEKPQLFAEPRIW